MSKRARRVLIRTTPHFAKYRLADEIEADEALISDTAPTPRMLPAFDMGRILRWTSRPFDALDASADVA